MKALTEVVGKREELYTELEYYTTLKNNLGTWSTLNEEDRKESWRLGKIIERLKIQINALTYVINYDSRLQDVTFMPVIISSRDDINEG